MAERPRIVIDTNLLISRLLSPRSTPGEAVRRAIDTGTIIASEATMGKLAAVLGRGKLDPYVTVEERQQFLRLLGRIVEMVPVLHEVRICRDSKDDKLLELAVKGGANLILSGDRDLLDLVSFRGIPILTAARYLER